MEVQAGAMKKLEKDLWDEEPSDSNALKRYVSDLKVFGMAEEEAAEGRGLGWFSEEEKKPPGGGGFIERFFGGSIVLRGVSFSSKGFWREMMECLRMQQALTMLPGELRRP